MDGLRYSGSKDIIEVPTLNNNKDIVDLRDKCPGVYNQGKIGSCTANALSAAYEYHEIQNNNKTLFVPSRLFIYFNERKIENTIDYDSGAQIRDGIKSLKTQGVCSEIDWPYDMNSKEKPYNNCYTEALNHKILTYHRIEQDIEHIKSCLSGWIYCIWICCL